MPEESVNTVMLCKWVDRMRAGDHAASDELLRAVTNRLERLARKMIQRFPTVQRWADTEDVLQNALLRLLRALQQVKPNSVRDFFGLAAEQMRRELLDLARKFYGPQGIGANHHSDILQSDDEGSGGRLPEQAKDLEDLEKWSLLHAEVSNLGVMEREVVGLILYHGWSQQAVADLFQVSVRTVQRRWESAMANLNAAVSGRK